MWCRRGSGRSRSTATTSPMRCSSSCRGRANTVTASRPTRCAPAGCEPHQIINTGAEDLRYLGFSTVGSVDVVDYPDSGKVGVAAGVKNADFKTATYVAMGRIQRADYFDGEDK